MKCLRVSGQARVGGVKEQKEGQGLVVSLYIIHPYYFEILYFLSQIVPQGATILQTKCCSNKARNEGFSCAANIILFALVVLVAQLFSIFCSNYLKLTIFTLVLQYLPELTIDFKNS